MLERFIDQVELLGCAGKKILVAISGGIDSVALLDLLTRAGYATGISHANFQLRGEESEGDEIFVRALGAAAGIPVFVERFDTAAYAGAHGLSTQMAARLLRYRWFKSVLERENYDCLATAHHLNDSLETTLLNLVRGTGLRGLSGIPRQAETIIRPLLSFTRQEIEAYAAQRGLRWREDSSNAHDHYRRNQIRHHVIPILKEINPALEETHARTLRRLTAAAFLAAQGLNQVRERYGLRQGDNILISRRLAAEVPYPAAVLFELISEYGFTLAQCDAMVITREGRSGSVFLSPGFLLVVDRESFILSPQRTPWGETTLAEGEHTAHLGPWSMTVDLVAGQTVSADPEVAFLDHQQLTFPLCWRQWKPGDAFHPLGMDHRKKISDFLIDKKIPVPDKNGVTVLESGGKIAWVVGHRIDDRFKVTDQTTRVVFFQVRPRRG
jgi:tRNA(Ile)-lysidine synthase